MSDTDTPPYVIRPFSEATDANAVVDLWRRTFAYDAPHNDPSLSLSRKRATGDGLLWVAVYGSAVVGTIMAGYDGHRGWLYSVAVDATHQGLGIGSALVRHAEVALADLGCLKINLQLVASNQATTAFYEALGYRVEPRISMGKVLHRSPSP
jgi:ribosomal protein S18 acetylase RimI-like enzyme